MLRAILLMSPLLVMTAAACGGSSDADFEGGPSAGTSGKAGSDGGSQGGADGKAGTPSSTGGTKTGSAGNTATSGSANSGGDESAGGVGGSSGLAGSSSDTAGEGPGSAGADGLGGAGNDAPCPDIFGDYDIQSSDGTCGSFNDAAVQSIQGTNMACFAHFVSAPPSGAQGINGGATLDGAGNFEGAKLYLDDVQRNPCNGKWDAGAQTMTVECGGQGDLCTVVLKKSP